MMNVNLSALVTTDWDDLGVVGVTTESIFSQLLSPGRLHDMLEALRHDEHLRGMCERYDFLDKLVLFDDADTGVRVRLHLFRSGYFDRPHNHRWSFASRILTGQYTHRLYGREDVILDNPSGAGLWPIMERVEHVGAEYVLHHNSVHAVQAATDTISLVLRGPARKDRFLIVDQQAQSSFWVEGAALETRDKREEKVMSSDTLESVVTRVEHLLVDLGRP